jgi:hypothetical protein
VEVALELGFGDCAAVALGECAAESLTDLNVVAAGGQRVGGHARRRMWWTGRRVGRQTLRLGVDGVLVLDRFRFRRRPVCHVPGPPSAPPSLRSLMADISSDTADFAFIPLPHLLPSVLAHPIYMSLS